MKIIDKMVNGLNIQTVSAHCDIPCKIYDPSMFLIPALSIIRMMDLMAELEAKPGDLAYENTLARYIAEKEENARIVKEEVRVIWGDYIKQPQIDAFPNVHELVHSIMLAASATKQTADRAKGLALLDKVNEFAELFWSTKGVKTKRAACPYPPSLEVVYPDL